MGQLSIKDSCSYCAGRNSTINEVHSDAHNTINQISQYEVSEFEGNEEFFDGSSVNHTTFSSKVHTECPTKFFKKNSLTFRIISRNFCNNSVNIVDQIRNA